MDNSTLTHVVLLQTLHYNPDTGVFTRLVPAPGMVVGQVAGGLGLGPYTRIGIGRKIYLAHRVAWFYMTGRWPSKHIDHIDGNPLNNKFSNLRDVRCAVNVQNVKGARSDSKSRLLGVDLHKRDGLWRARICVDGVRHQLGYFQDKHEAYAVYLDAKRRLHEGCTI